MDAALLNLLLTIALLGATLLFRKRLLAALGRLLFAGSIEFAKRELLTEEVVEVPDGGEVRKIGLSMRGKALLAALMPVVIAEAIKSVKLKPGAIPTLPPGLDLTNLSEALPAILPMLPKRYQGIAALAAPFIQGFLGGGKEGGKKANEKIPDHLQHVSR